MSVGSASIGDEVQQAAGWWLSLADGWCWLRLDGIHGRGNLPSKGMDGSWILTKMLPCKIQGG